MPLKFRLKLLVAMMLVVFAVTSATLYLAGKNVRAKQQETLETQFQNEVRSYLALQESRLSGINRSVKPSHIRCASAPPWKSAISMTFIATR